MIVDCAIYRNGRREDVSGDLSDALDRARASAEGFIWVGLYEPTPDEFELVAREFALHPLAVEDAIHAHQRPKLERYGASLFLVLKTLRYIEETSAIETGQIMLFVGSGFVVTVRHGQACALGPVRQRLEEEDRVLRHGPSGVVYAVCDYVVDTYGSIAAAVQQDIEEIEELVFSPARTNDAERIYSLKREVLEFRRAVLPLAEPMRVLVGETLGNGAVPGLDEEARPFFRDVADHVLRVSEQVEYFDDLLTSVLNANLAQVSVRQNEDMRKISAWGAIFILPTVVGSIYGMNFHRMPELSWPLGYFYALAVMAAACATLYVAFRKSGWL